MTSTIICVRAPGMTMFRLPIFAWNILGHQRADLSGLRTLRPAGRIMAIPHRRAMRFRTRGRGICTQQDQSI